jgi:hypothetical protein
MLSGIGGVPVNALTAAESFFASRGMTGTANFLYGAQSGLSNTGALVGGGAAAGSLITGGAGFAGGLLANQLFSGQYVGLGSGIGGIGGGIAGASLLAGTAFGGPLGAALGAVAGGALGSLFGGKNKGDNKGRALLDFATGDFSAFGVGKSFNPENVQAVQEISAVLQQFAAAIGGSTASLNVSMGNRSGLGLDGQKFGKDQAGFLKEAFSKIIEGAGQLSQELKTLIKNFDGSAEEVAAFSMGLVSISKQMKENPVEIAVRDFTDAQEMAGKTLTEVFKDQLSAIDELTSSFDGSIDSVTELNTLMSQNSQLAYDLATALQAVGVTISDTVGNQISFFEDAVRTPDERLRFQQSEFERLFAMLPDLRDPVRIESVSSQLLGLNRSIFETGPGGGQRANVGVYIDAARAIEDAANAALAAAQASLGDDIEVRNASVQSAITTAAQAFQQPANTMEQAAQTFANAVNNFVNSGGIEVVA